MSKIDIFQTQIAFSLYVQRYTCAVYIYVCVANLARYVYMCICRSLPSRYERDPEIWNIAMSWHSQNGEKTRNEREGEEVMHRLRLHGAILMQRAEAGSLILPDSRHDVRIDSWRPCARAVNIHEGLGDKCRPRHDVDALTIVAPSRTRRAIITCGCDVREFAFSRFCLRQDLACDSARVPSNFTFSVERRNEGGVLAAPHSDILRDTIIISLSCNISREDFAEFHSWNISAYYSECT